MKTGLKHLIECHCVLPQYRNLPDPIYHRFVVFSELEDDEIIVKLTQCNNCGVIHRVFDIGKSEILLGKDENASIVTIDDVKISIPQNIANVLESYRCDISTWEHARFILEQMEWNSCVLLSSENRDGTVEGKLMRFMGLNSIRIEPYILQQMFP